jgi:A-macroglobulin TED domain/Alpha-2-macroglobulin family
MHTCPECQAQLLEYLYDLLDAPERQAMQAHLAGCALCRAALTKAENHQKLLATAARMEFPNVRFQAPVERIAPSVVPMSRPIKKARPWRRWAAAAAILLALAGLSAPGYWMERDYSQANRIITEKKAVALAANQRRADALAQIRDLPRLENEKIAAVQKAERETQLKISVRGPATATAGAPSTYEVDTDNLNGQPVAANLTAHLEYGETKQAVNGLIPVVRAGDGKYNLTLPADLPLKPQQPLTLWVSANRLDGAQSAQVSEKLDLASPVYVTHLDTDKPMYQPGEVVYYRSLTLERFSLKPAQEDLRLTYELVTPTGGKQTLIQGANGLSDAGGGEMLGPDGKPIRGVGAGELLLEPNLEGGEYTLVCREEANRFPAQRRKFLVNNYPKPQLNKKLDYSRSTYGPGDEVSALCSAFRANGDPVRNQPVEATVMIDDKKYGADGKETQQPLHFQTDAQGTVVVHFKLPAAMERGQASLGVTFLGNPVETIARPLPIVLKKLNVEFYPEGGDLVADLPNRVYFQVRTTLGKPADLTGRLFEDGKETPVAVQTLHDAKEPGVNQGEGRFEFTPKSGKKYELQIDSPIGINSRVPLPDVKEDGVALSVPDGTAEAGQPIKAIVHSKKPRDLMVGLYCRGRLLHSVQLKKGEIEAVLSPTDGAGGVCRVTVFEETAVNGDRRELKPVAERLVYRQPTERLTVNIRPNLSSYVPGQKVQLGVETFNEKGEPAPAVVMLAVVDKSILTLADEKTYRQMPTHFLLTSEVRKPEDLEYADFLLGPQAKAMEALDLLLGVQGWRRFAQQDPAKFREKNVIDKEEAESLLVMEGQSPRKTDGAEEEIDAIRKSTDAELAQLNEQANQARSAAAAALGDPGYASAVTKVDSYKLLGEQVRVIGTPLVGAALLTAALIFLIVGVVRGMKRAAPWYAGALASVALLIGVVLFYRTSEMKPMQMDAGRQMARLDEITDLPAPAKDVEREFTAPEGAAADMALDDNEKLAKNADAFDFADANGAPHAAKTAAPTPLAAGLGALARPATGMMGRGGAKPGEDKFGVLNAPQGNFALKAGLQDQLHGEPQGQAKDLGLQQEFFAGAAQDAPPKDRRFDGLKRKGLAEGLDRGALLEQTKMGTVLADRDEAQGVLKRLQKQRQQVLFRRLGGIPAPLPPTVKMVVREYAHEHPAGATPELRSDFAETLCWRPALVLPNGKADVSFDICDSAVTFQALAFAHTLDGRLGAGVKVIESRLPFALQPAVPIEVTSSDKIDVPVSVANNTPERRDVQVTLKTHNNLKLLDGNENASFAVDGDKTARPLYRFQPTIKEGEATLEFTGKTEPFAYDGVRAAFRVAPEGFPVAESHSEVLEGSASQTVTLPETWVKGTLKCQVQVYPSTLADLQKGLDSLLREPNGCFEQTSTSNYPNLLILDYLKESNQTKPEVESRARELLGRGYTKLTSFECTNTAKNDKEGYEWFGGTAPAHEALTAYGLLQFRDMARVRDVDPAMLKRTQDFLMSRRDGKGGFLRNPAAIDSFGRAPDDVTNAYIVWALTESGKDDDLTKELNTLGEQAKTSKDPYFLSLVANSLINRARTDEGVKLLQTVAGAQKEDGHLDAEKTSITGSGGRDLEIETTALAVLGWLKANPGTFNAPLQKAVKWIGQQRGGYGGFGSTQSTILALKALIAYTNANKRTAEGGEIRLYVGDKEEAKLQFAPGAAEALTLALPDAEKVLQPGPNKVRVEITGKNTFPYTLAWTYQTLKPASADDCPVRLETKLSQTEVQEGGLVRLNMTLKNVSGNGQGMATVILGLPGGLTVPEDMKQLKQYTRVPEDGSRPLVSAFEIRGRELVLYWRDLAPDQTIQVPLDLIARIPGEYSGPASRGYLYYNADHKHWVEPLRVKIAAKME